MARPDDPQDYRTIYEGYDFLVADIECLLPRHKNFPKGSWDVEKPWSRDPAVWGSYYKVSDREVDTLYIHQTAGSVSVGGFEAVRRTAQFSRTPPGWLEKDGRWLWNGLGRGWPGIGYTYYLPYRPHVHRGKPVIYRCWCHDWVTWHSGDNARSIAIACQGYFKSRHIRRFKPRKGCTGGEPSRAQMDALRGFVFEYVIDHLRIDPERVLGHCESPKAKKACPGDTLEEFARAVSRGSATPELPGAGPAVSLYANHLRLPSWKERQAALVALGHFIGTTGKKGNGVDGDPGDRTRMAIEMVEESIGLRVDGYWDDTLDYHIKTQLSLDGIGQDEIDELIG